MAEQTIMTIAGLKQLLNEFGNEIADDFQVWLSSDEEGNQFLPMYDNPQLCLAFEPEEKRIILFPSHC